ncbi:MAG TPA: ATPase, T2SS/T4P/T4SS family [bacterium]|nr:ATPase, T2SS/T4P/T4SS family [bacterium]
MTTVERPNGSRPPRILAVDDQPANLTLVRKILTPAGFEVGEARSGAEALATARERPPDLILLDMHLPDMHGLEVLRRLRESAWGAGLKVVAMSALANPEDQRLWLRAGCLGAIEKPITVATFVETVIGFLTAPEDGAEQPFALPGDWAERDRLGDILVAAGLTSSEQLARAVAIQRSSGKRLGQILVEQGAVSEDDIAWALSSQLGYPYIFLTPDIIDEGAARALPDDFLRQRRVLPILRFGEEMTLAMADPTDQRTVDEVAGRTRLAVKRALALGSNIEAMLDRLFAWPRATPDAEVTAEAQYLQFHLVQALQQDAVEIHFDPADEGQARVRYRLWGDLVDRAAQPAELHAAVLRHLRRLTGAGEEAATVAGAPVIAAGHDLYLRAAFLPTTAGPAATVTLYPRRAEVPSLLPLGVPERTVGIVRKALGAARGLVLVGCADGLLRSTLLHALLPEVQRGKVWTLETLPVYRRPTLNQTTFVRPEEAPAHLRAAAAAGADLLALDDIGGRGGLTAACEIGAARMILAAHPHDETAGLLALLVEAAGAASAAAALRAVVTARPIRLLCPSCKEATIPEAAVPEAGLARGAHTFSPRGCEACGFTGFRGRRLLTALWLVDGDDRGLLRAGQTEALYDRVARESAESLREQGRSLVEDGLTSPAELARLIEDA